MYSAYLTNDLVLNLAVTNVLLILAFIILYRNYYQLKARVDFLRSHHKLLDAKEIAVLYKHFPYYRKLSTSLRRKFERRVAHFRFSKQYLDANGGLVSEKKKMLIAAYAAQFTFGMDRFEFSHFSKVIIYPATFYSQLSGSFKSWEVDPNGVIMLSWKDFYMGMKSGIGMNPVGLRVMATVLQMESGRKNRQRFELSVSPDRIQKNQLGMKTDRLFENIDLVSTDQFLVACLVNFFDKPMQFKNQYPGLFKEVDHLLHEGVLKNAS